MFLKVVDISGNDGKELFDKDYFNINRANTVTEVIEEETKFIISVDREIGEKILNYNFKELKTREVK